MREMRRKDRQITDPEKIRNIILDSQCCRLGFCDDGEVYIVPLSYGYAEEDGKQVFYFHSAGEGRKVELIGKNPRVGFELDTGYRLQADGPAHECTAAFQSIIGTGVVEFVTGTEEKIRALDCILTHYRGKADGKYPADLLQRVCIFKMTVNELACKEHE